MVSLDTLIHVVLGIGSFILGVIVIILGAINAGRFGESRVSKRVYKSHKYISLIFALIATISFFWGISSLIIEGHEIFQSIHSWTGLFIVIISVLQITPSLTIQNRKKLHNLHKYLAYILLIIISIQLITGIIQTSVHLLE